MIPENNEDLWAKNKAFTILHSYILERVRGIEACGLTCYISNEQLAYETNTSISTISRAIRLLVKEKMLWVSYHQMAVANRQRVMRIFCPEIRTQAAQNDNDSLSECIPEIVELTPSDDHIEQLVNKRRSKKINSISKDYDLDFDIDYISKESECSVDTDADILSTSGDADPFMGYIDKCYLHGDKPPSIYEKSLLDLSYSEREEILDDVSMGMLAEEDIPCWVTLYQKRWEKALEKMGYPPNESRKGFFGSVVHGKVMRALEDVFFYTG